MPAHLFQPVLVFAMLRFAAAGSFMCVVGATARVYSQSLVLVVFFLVTGSVKGTSLLSVTYVPPLRLLTTLLGTCSFRQRRRWCGRSSSFRGSSSSRAVYNKLWHLCDRSCLCAGNASDGSEGGFKLQRGCPGLLIVLRTGSRSWETPRRLTLFGHVKSRMRLLRGLGSFVIVQFVMSTTSCRSHQLHKAEGPSRMRSEMDHKHGSGNLRPNFLFLFTQPRGKQRLITDCNKEGHNLSSFMEKAIMVRNDDFIPEAVQLLCRVHLRDFGVESSEVPLECVKETMTGLPDPWSIGVGTDDHADAH